MKILKIVLIVLSCVVVFYTAKFAKISLSVPKDDLVLRVGTSYDYMPYTYQDIKTGKIVGFDIDMIEQVALRMGKTVQIEGMPFSSLIFGLFSGSIDVIASAMSPTERRRNAVLFSENYLSGDPLVIVSKSSQGKFNSIVDLQNKKVVVNTGFVADNYISGQKDINIVRLKTPADALTALQSGSVDAWVCAQSSAQAFLEKISDGDQYVLTALEGTGDDYAFVVAKYNEKLADQINVAIDSIRADGTLDILKQKWKLS